MKFLEQLAAMLKQDAAALSAQGADLEPLFAAAHAQLMAHAKTEGDLLAALREPLALSDGDTVPTVTGKLLSLLEKGKSDAAALTEIQARVSVLEGEQKARVIADLKAEGKLTAAMQPWAEKQDVAALTDWAKTAPVVVQPQRIVKPGDAHVDDTEALSDNDVTVARKCGLDPAKVAAANGLKLALDK